MHSHRNIRGRTLSIKRTLIHNQSLTSVLNSLSTSNSERHSLSSRHIRLTSCSSRSGKRRGSSDTGISSNTTNHIHQTPIKTILSQRLQISVGNSIHHSATGNRQQLRIIHILNLSKSTNLRLQQIVCQFNTDVSILGGLNYCIGAALVINARRFDTGTGELWSTPVEARDGYWGDLSESDLPTIRPGVLSVDNSSVSLYSNGVGGVRLI